MCLEAIPDVFEVCPGSTRGRLSAFREPPPRNLETFVRDNRATFLTNSDCTHFTLGKYNLEFRQV